MEQAMVAEVVLVGEMVGFPVGAARPHSQAEHEGQQGAEAQDQARRH